jgi:ribokinase
LVCIKLNQKLTFTFIIKYHLAMIQGKVTVIGSSNTDMVIKSQKLPAPGETILGGSFLMNPGGKGANQAVAAARLGGKVTFVAKTGNDIFGKQAVQLFENERINTGYIITDPDNPSGVALITVDAKAENCIVVAPGANSNLLPADIEKAKNEITASEIVLLQLEIPIETVVHAAKMAKFAGVKTVLNPAPACELPSELYPLLYLITPNETETELLTGIKVTDEASANKAAEVLVKKGVEKVVITMGSRGAYLFDNGKGKIIPTPKVQAVDTTAAGDVFNGALVVGIAEQKPLEEALMVACKAASISVTRMGAQASAPYWHEL